MGRIIPDTNGWAVCVNERKIISFEVQLIAPGIENTKDFTLRIDRDGNRFRWQAMNFHKPQTDGHQYATQREAYAGAAKYLRENHYKEPNWQR